MIIVITTNNQKLLFKEANVVRTEEGTHNLFFKEKNKEKWIATVPLDCVIYPGETLNPIEKNT